ncbi:MAG: glycine--tRNA ligase subunit beta [Terriglobia bacterium]
MKAPRTRPLLVEIGCEEIPARFLDAAREDFARGLSEALKEARLLPASATVPRSYSTPRRLVVLVPEVLVRQADQVEELVGPPVKVAFDAAGNPTRAAESFAAKNAVKVGDLARVTTPKGEYLAVRKTLRGKPAGRLLSGILPRAITGLSFPKSMYWVAKAGPRFVRPIRWLLALSGEGPEANVIPFQVAGVKSADLTYGHRALRPGRIRVRGFEDYAKKLRRAFVEFDPETRREKVQSEAQVLLEDGLKLVEDRELAQWVVNSTEWPTGIRGGFDARFLHLPREILITVMRDHQKYFSLENRQGELEPSFVAILNMDEDARGLIRRGHERVLAARFADAEFFWNSDQRVPLAGRAERLARVTYQAQLGSYADKVERMRQIARLIVQALADQDRITHEEAEHALRAVELSKCDLTTQMVQEFTELQGVVGGLYAAAQGEPEGVATAIYDHYKPAGLEDSAPRSIAGAVVSLADKLDSVVGGFAVGQEPTGSSDPFALRRQGNGIVKVLVEGSISIDLRPLIEQALNTLTIDWQKPQAEVFTAVLDFLAERLRFYLETVRGLRYDTVRAVRAAGADNPAQAAERALALEQLRGGEDFEALSVAAKRIKNILAKSASASDWQPGEVDGSLLESGPEADLYADYTSVSVAAAKLAATGEYGKALESIAALRPAVDKFFDKVLVMAEDRAVRENRLRLLGKLDALFSGIAQFAEIAS